MPKLHGAPVLKHLVPYLATPGRFFALEKSHFSCVFIARTPPRAELYTAYDQKLSFSNLQIYTVRVGAVNGIVAGYLFHTPLLMKLDPYYVVFHRKRVDVLSDLVYSGVETVKRFSFDAINVNTNDAGYLLTLRGLDNDLLKFAAQT